MGTNGNSFAALADPTRRAVFERLRQGPRPVGDIARDLPVSRPAVSQHLGTNDFLRLRIGVGRPGRGDPRPVADYVLSPFDPTFDVDALVARAADAVEQLAAEGLEATQRAVN